jgi:hypothetical protein
MADQQTGLNPTQWIATNEAAELAGCTSCLPKRKLTKGSPENLQSLRNLPQLAIVAAPGAAGRAKAHDSVCHLPLQKLARPLRVVT